VNTHGSSLTGIACLRFILTAYLKPDIECFYYVLPRSTPGVVHKRKPEADFGFTIYTTRTMRSSAISPSGFRPYDAIDFRQYGGQQENQKPYNCPASREQISTGAALPQLSGTRQKAPKISAPDLFCMLPRAFLIISTRARPRTVAKPRSRRACERPEALLCSRSF